MKSGFGILLFISVVATAAVFAENTDLWDEVDSINQALEQSEQLDSDAIEALFQRAVEVALSGEFSQQFEDLRSDYFDTEDISLFDEYAERAEGAITVFYMGESNNIGVSVSAFLDVCPPESEAYSFFLVSTGGFYVGSEYPQPGTAELPAWMEPSGSSAQAEAVPRLAEEWLGYWETVRPGLDGCFLDVADVTITTLTTALQ